MDATLAIVTLGSPAITLDGIPVRGFVSNKAAALVYYLAATGRPHTRESLAGLLWAEATESHAHKNLRDVLSNLRRLLDPYLQITRQTVSFTSAGAELVDSRRFEARVEAAQRQSLADGVAALREAVELYRGDFLEGFSVADAPAFEEWALIQREQLRRFSMDALHSLAADAADRGAYAEGIGYAARLLAIDPTREEAYRQKMLLLALSGQRGAALAQYEICRRVLNDELGLDPDEETEALQRRILAGEVVGDQPGPAVAAPIRPHHYLPAPLATFIGRAAELDQIIEQLRGGICRLITLTGAGGVGKTRLALQAAHQLLPASQQGAIFAHGIVFVGLAAVGAAGWGEQDGEQAVYPILAARVADVLRFTFSGPEAPHVQLGHYLREKHLLLVLDNCEHLPMAGFVVELLEQAPTLTVLVTSRGRLNVRGEYVVELAGLPFPNRREIAERTDLDTYSALQLFRHNAHSVNPRLDWTSATMTAAAQICELVAGLPLGIELAASLVRLMPCEEIAREIEANLNFLQSVRRDVPERHQNLQAVFDHSWKLLNTAEQRALQQIAVFRGSFDREAAARVAGITLPLLASLVDNSLVRRVTVQNEAAGRYELQELVRQYTTEKLVAQSARDEQMAVLDRHCHHYLNFLSQRKANLRGRRQAEALAEINIEIENIRGAWRWALAEGHVELISQASDSLFYFYETRGWFQEGAEVFAMAAGRISDLHLQNPRRETGIARGKLLAHQGWCAFQVGRQAEARGLLERSLAILRPLEAQAELVLPLNYLAAAAYYSGDYVEAEQLVEEALRLSLACHDQHGTAVAKTILGQIAYLVGHYEDAQRHSQESIAIERELGNRWGMVFALISLGRVDQALGEYESARRSFQEGLAIREMLGDARGIALCLDHLGDTEEALANYGAARWCYQESLARFQEIDHQVGAATSLTKLGYNALAIQEPKAARAYFQDALRIAWISQAIPRALEALAGIATVLSDDWADQASELAELVLHHPAATQESRDRAGAVLARLALPAARHAQALTQRQQEVRPLAAVVMTLLA
jgi:predicted ATPase/DNA-binding SARP family transcriptional activator